MIWLLTFLLSLPASVWLLATLLSVMDQRPLSLPLIRIGIAGCLIVLFLLITAPYLWSAILRAFILVFALHALSGWAFRHLGLQAQVHSSFEKPAGNVERAERVESAE